MYVDPIFTEVPYRDSALHGICALTSYVVHNDKSSSSKVKNFDQFCSDIT